MVTLCGSIMGHKKGPCSTRNVLKYVSEELTALSSVKSLVSITVKK